MEYFVNLDSIIKRKAWMPDRVPPLAGFRPGKIRVIYEK
jgi:hypothetical protein